MVLCSVSCPQVNRVFKLDVFVQVFKFYISVIRSRILCIKYFGIINAKMTYELRVQIYDLGLLTTWLFDTWTVVRYYSQLFIFILPSCFCAKCLSHYQESLSKTLLFGTGEYSKLS